MTCSVSLDNNAHDFVMKNKHLQINRINSLVCMSFETCIVMKNKNHDLHMKIRFSECIFFSVVIWGII